MKRTAKVVSVGVAMLGFSVGDRVEVEDGTGVSDYKITALDGFMAGVKGFAGEENLSFEKQTETKGEKDMTELKAGDIVRGTTAGEGIFIMTGKGMIKGEVVEASAMHVDIKILEHENSDYVGEVAGVFDWDLHLLERVKEEEKPANGMEELDQFFKSLSEIAELFRNDGDTDEPVEDPEPTDDPDCSEPEIKVGDKVWFTKGNSMTRDYNAGEVYTVAALDSGAGTIKITGGGQSAAYPFLSDVVFVSRAEAETVAEPELKVGDIVEFVEEGDYFGDFEHNGVIVEIDSDGDYKVFVDGITIFTEPSDIKRSY